MEAGKITREYRERKRDDDDGHRLDEEDYALLEEAGE
jgi:hypothetical protein